MIIGCGNYNGESVSNNDLAFVVYVSFNGQLRVGIDANKNTFHLYTSNNGNIGLGYVAIGY